MRQPYQNGFRLPVPSTFREPHFAYHVDIERFSCLSVFSDEAKNYVKRRPLGLSQIEAFSVTSVSRTNELIKPALEKVVDALKLTEYEAGSAQVVFCEWASLHEDFTFAGKAFLSVVAHTGPQPYVMQLLNSKVNRTEGGYASMEANTSVMQLNEGDVIIFDPTTPHMAAPKRPRTGQFLVLLQFELNDEDEHRREEILRRFPAKIDVVSGHCVFADHSSDPIDFVQSYQK